MNYYQFEAITREFSKRFGKIPRGQEHHWNVFFFTIDSNVLKVHRRFPNANDYRLREGLLMALHTIKGRLDGVEPDLASVENNENRLFCNAILSGCDPFFNEELRQRVAKQVPDLSREDADREGIYKESVKCLVRMVESVDFWTKRGGANGYFDMVEMEIGKKVPYDDKMNFTMALSE